MTEKRRRAIATAVALASAALLCACSKPADQQFSALGFTPLQPPSTILAPGAIVVVKQRDPFRVGLLCTAEAAFGSDIARLVVKSPSVATATTRQLELTSDLDATSLKALAANADASAVEGIAMTTSNVVIKELPDSVVMDNVRRRAQTCASGIAMRRRLGATVSVIKSVVAADVAYLIRYSAGADASVRASATQRIAGSLGLAGNVSGDTAVAGKQLVWAVSDDTDLANVDGATLPATGSDGPHRLLPVGQPVIVDPQP